MTSAMLMAYASPIECNAFQEIPHDIWYLDSGCNNHMTGNLNLFSNLEKSVQTYVQVTVLRKGNVGILTKQGGSKFILDVYHVEGLKNNLLSIGQLIQKS